MEKRVNDILTSKKVKIINIESNKQNSVDEVDWTIVQERITRQQRDFIK